MKTWKTWLPWALTGPARPLAPLSPCCRSTIRTAGFAEQTFGRLPVLANGRVQPIDSLARNSLLQLREKQTAQTAPGQSGSDRALRHAAGSWR